MRSRFGVMAALALIACGGNADEGKRTGADDGGAPPAAAEAASPARTIIFIGTSLTAGLGLEPEESYPARIAQRIDSLGLGWRVVNAGVSGETSAGALRRVGWLLREPAQIIVLETGANDGLRGLGLDSMRANIAAILDSIHTRQPRARIYLAAMEAPPNLGPSYTSGFRAVFPELARRSGATLIPFFLEDVAGRPGLNQGDGMHPNAEGARVAAEAMWRALEPALRAHGAPVDATAGED